jgi:serine/threonine-protein kinase
MSDVLSRLTTALADRYRVVRELGAGGMATVYLAHDLRHERDVAIKVLHPDLGAALGAERFLAEIKTTAKLQHPHILPLLDSGAADGLLYYVMPYVRGETLRARLERDRQLAIPDALQIAREVADALHAAHALGVVHRDIKPENILLQDGHALVADFGIALAVQQAGGQRMTQTGLSLGTPQYMSPEQAMGERTIDARSDVYALGAVLYEMLAGDAPFTGSSVQAIVAKVLNEKPTSLRTLRDTVPPHIELAVFTALAKLPADRFESARAFATALHGTVSTPVPGIASPAPATPARPWWRQPASLAALLTIAVLGATLAWRQTGSTRAEAPGTRGVTRVSVVIPDDSTLLRVITRGFRRDLPSVSPDGRAMLLSAITSNGPTILLRPLDRFEPTTLAAQGAQYPFFSADGRRVAYFLGSELWAVSLAEREPIRLATIPEPDYNITSAAWHPDGRVFVTARLGVYVVPAQGGAPALVRTTDGKAPCQLDDVQLIGSSELLLNCSGPGGPHVQVMSADLKERRPALDGAVNAFVIEDVVLFFQQQAVRASRFKAGRFELIGPTVTVDVSRQARLGRSIVWDDSSASEADLQAVFREQRGTMTPLPIDVRRVRWPRLSPNGRQLATWAEGGLRVFDLTRGVSWPLHGVGEPTWTPDGRWPAFYGAYPDASAGPTQVDVGDAQFVEIGTTTKKRLALPGFQRGARFSPNGRWVAYTSSETGPNEVFVCAWPSLDRRTKVSVDGGDEPVWARGGDTLFFRHRDDINAVTVSDLGGAIATTRPTRYFAGGQLRDRFGDQSYDIAPDGRFLLVRVPPRAGRPVVLQLELNWIEEVRARLDRAARDGGR